MATKFATDEEIAAAVQAWPRDVPDEVHIRAIMKEHGVTHDVAQMTLDLGRGDWEGDVEEVSETA